MGILTDEESLNLSENYAYRKKMVEEAFRTGIPDSPKDIEAINGVLNSMDKSIYDNVTARLKHQENQNKGAIISAVSEALRNISNSKEASLRLEKINDVTELELPIDTVEGELEIGDKKFSLNEIILEEGDKS